MGTTIPRRTEKFRGMVEQAEGEDAGGNGDEQMGEESAEAVEDAAGKVENHRGGYVVREGGKKKDARVECCCKSCGC